MQTKCLTRWIVGVISIGILLSGCDSASREDGFGGAASAAPQVSQVSASSANPPVEEGANVPAQTQKLPESTAELLAGLDYEDRKRTESFYANFGDALEFENTKEFQWMRRHGYPLPEEIAAATRLTDSELQRRFESGDFKSGVFLLERMAVRANGSHSTDASLLADRLLDSGNPFSGYAYFRYFREIKGGWSDALAGLLWAYQQGDYRAGQLFAKLVKTGGPFGEQLEPGEVAFSFVALQAHVRLMNPDALSGRLDPLIIYETERH